MDWENKTAFEAPQKRRGGDSSLLKLLARLAWVWPIAYLPKKFFKNFFNHRYTAYVIDFYGQLYL